MEKYLDSLNDSQREAVTYCDGPQLVIAGAGSGKTRVLTLKIAYLLAQGYHPDEILALTFTKKAATEMQQRIQQIVGPAPARRLWMGTFHSIFSRILRREAARLGFRSDFTIYDQSDSRSLIKAIIKELGLDDKTYKPNNIQSQISNAKNNLVTPGMYEANRELRQYDIHAKRPMIFEIYKRYWNRCIQAGAMDFDDLLLYTNILFRDHPDCLEFYQQYFRYILVDEYQDTNRAQHLIVDLLQRHHHHLMVVGDDAQSIYSFRGANIRNILDMERNVPGTRLFKLEQNYRSTQNIVDAANSLIRCNRDQIQKNIFSQRNRGSQLQLTGTYSDIEEAYSVARKIQELRDNDGYQYGDCAVLYRTNAQSRTLEEALRKRGIEYRIFGGLSFYQRKEIKDIIAYLRLITNPADEEAFKRIINYPARGIGQTTIEKLSAIVAQGGCNFFDVCSDPIAHNVQVNKGTESKLRGFVALISHFQELNQKLDAYTLTNTVIVESGIKADLSSDTSVEAISRRENVEELLSAIQSFTVTCHEEGRPEEARLLNFLSEVSLSGDVEPTSSSTDGEPQDYVNLMTIHQSKGLEFKNVFICGIEENLLPSDMALNEPGGVEEERRLFYVAITRAEENCFLSYSTSRFRNGKSEACRMSRFIRDIDRRFILQTNADSALQVNYATTGGGTFDSLSRWDAPRQKSSSFQRSASSDADTLHRHTISPTPVNKPTSSVLDFTGPVRKITHKPGEKRPVASASSQVEYEGKIIKAGSRIVHERFGEGTVITAEGASPDIRLSVEFDNLGPKTLLLKYAKIRLL